MPEEKKRARLVEYITKFITNGDCKITIQDKTVVCIRYKINEVENKFTLEDIKD